MPNCAAVAANTSDQANEKTPGNAAFQGSPAADVVPANAVNALGTWEFPRQTELKHHFHREVKRSCVQRRPGERRNRYAVLKRSGNGADVFEQ